MREYQNTAREKKDEISLEGKHTGDGNPRDCFSAASCVGNLLADPPRHSRSLVRLFHFRLGRCVLVHPHLSHGL